MRKISVIIPCFNEEKTIKEILDRVVKADFLDWEKEIIVVDDFSSDKTREILSNYSSNIKVYYQDKNGGKGTAVKRGIEESTGDYIIIQDADLEYNPDEIKSMLKAIDNKSCRVVYGSRNLHENKREGFVIPRLGAWLITKVLNSSYNLQLTDAWTCYKLFPKEVAKEFVSGGFESELLFTIAIAKKGFNICEVPISHNPRDKEDGKKIRYRDGFLVLWLIYLDKLLSLKPEEVSYKAKDTSSLVSCPLCLGDLEKGKDFYRCLEHGKFKIDKSFRPILINNDVFTKNSIEHREGISWLKSFLKQFPKLYYFVWGVFCPVLMVQNGPRNILKLLNKDSIVLDIGSGPERLGNEFINVDVYPFDEVDIVADASKLPFKDNSIDGVVSESVLEHIENPSDMVDEMVRVTKKGGYIYISAPFIHPYHASPDDFGRWSMSGLKLLLSNDVKIVESGVRSGPWSAFLMFLAYWLGNIFSLGFIKIAPFLTHIFMLVLGPLKIFDLIFANIPGAEDVSAHLYIVGRKKF
ncbi:glycosyltransferase [Patescibacteria group bacterium]